MGSWRADSRPHRGVLATIVSLAMVLPVASVQAASPSGGFTAVGGITGGVTISADLDKMPAGVIGNDISVIVKLDFQGLASYQGGRAGLSAAGTRSGKHVNLRSANSRRYLSFARQQQNAFEQRLKARIPGAQVRHRYSLVYGGVSVIVPRDRVPDLARIPGVTALHRDELLKLDTDASPQFIGAPTVWNKLGGQESAGEGVVVGVLDTGVWPEHPSMSDPDPSGKPYAAPPPPVSGTRQCEFSGGANPGPAFSCNNKLIGADRFMATYDALVGLIPGEFTTARDDNGHGTHTSSTAAGNAGVAASIFGVSRGTISGIAPRAHVIMYKVCGESGCFGSDSAAAIQKSITDGADVLNFSISGGNNPYGDAVELAFLDAYNAGVFPAASAGNSGPTPETVAHRGPWVTTVAASTADRQFLTTISVTSTAGAPMSIPGVSVTAGIGSPTPVVDAGAAPTSDEFCNVATADGAFAGKIVLCKRGGPNGRVQKGYNVKQRGAAGMILYNAVFQDQETDNHFLPAVHIQSTDGTALVAYTAANTGVVASWPASTAQPGQGDVMAGFSSRGGPGQSLSISKPDITAPGVSILAGHTPASVDINTGPTGELFQAIAGTSMSSPHIAGSAALIAALHPTWTPGQIKSALMTSAKTDGLVKEDGTTPFTPFDAGSGRVDLTRAGKPGITFDVTGASYISNQSQLYKTNYPSIYIPQMLGGVTLFKTAHSVTTTNRTWTVSTETSSDWSIEVPSSIWIAAGGDRTFPITIRAPWLDNGEVRHGAIKLTSGTLEAHIPVTIVRAEGNLTLEKVCPSDIVVTTKVDCTITATNSTFDDTVISIRDTFHGNIKLVNNSVTNGQQAGPNKLVATTTLDGSTPPDPSLAPGSSPAGGYVPLSGFVGTLVVPAGDDTITNFNVPAFTFAGETYSQIGISSNGYVVVGAATAADNSVTNQDFPDPARPNNVLALFWTDLNPAAAGTVRINVLTNGSDDWIVVDWAAVREFSNVSKLHSFEAWIGVNGDTNPGEDISYAYGSNTGNGDGGFLSVGVENRFGNRGNNTYYDGTGTLPSNGTQLRVTSTAPIPGETFVVGFKVKGLNVGPYQNCARMRSDAFDGVSVDCVSGNVIP